MKSLALIFLGIAGLLLIAYLCFNYNRPLIENDLASRTSKGLAAANLHAVTPSADGQTITLNGTVNNENSRSLAESLAASINGVNQVKNELKLAPDSKPESPKAQNNEQREQAPTIGINESKTAANKALQSVVDEAVQESESETLLNREAKQTSIQTAQAETVIALAPEKDDAELEQRTQEAMNSCQIQFDQLLAHEKIRFNSGSAILSRQSIPLLNKLADTTKSCPQFKIRIAGHTDSSGPAELNQVISEQRALRVYEALVSRGVNSANISTVGFGASEPITTNATRQGRAQNRRIEFKVEGN